MINKQEIQQLLQSPSTEKLSILMPTHRYGHQVIQGHDALTLKNQLKEARQRLKMKGWEEDRIRRFLRPAFDLLDNEAFWAYQSDGLAIYLSEEVQQIHQLPIPFEKMVYLGDEFYLKPLTPLVDADTRFFILCLSQNQVAFYEATAHSITSVKIDDLVPMGMEELQSAHPEKVLQMHAVSAHQPAQFHGHGGRNDKIEVTLEKYLRAVDTGLMEMLHDEHVPMIFAGVDNVFAAYKQINSYPHLKDEFVSGNPFSMGMAMVQEHGWKQVKPHFDQERQSFVEKYNAMAHKDTTTTSIDVILRAASQGRVECLFSRDDKNLWGAKPANQMAVQVHPLRAPESQCLLNLASNEALRHGGKVLNLPPSQMPINTKAP
jgi:hypothetical protein